MTTDMEAIDIKKSMAYDIINVVESSEKESYTPDEIKAIIKTYIACLPQK